MDFDQSCYEASLGAGAEQNQVADALVEVCNAERSRKTRKCPYLGNRWIVVVVVVSVLDYFWSRVSPFFQLSLNSHTPL